MENVKEEGAYKLSLERQAFYPEPAWKAHGFMNCRLNKIEMRAHFVKYLVGSF